MKIYINENYEIKAINSTDDELLEEIEVNRADVFGDKSDFMILNYCYKQDEYGYSIYPASDYSKLVEEDYKMFKKFWPQSVAKILTFFYKEAIKTNQL